MGSSQVVEDALSGDLSVPTIGGCSGCAERDRVIRVLAEDRETLRDLIRKQNALIEMADQFTQAYEAQAANRAARRAAARKQNRLGPVVRGG